MTCRDSGDCEYGLVAVKRRWVPEWLFVMFAPVIPVQPFRWIFTKRGTKPSAVSTARARGMAMGKQCFICGREIAPRTAFTMQGERSYHPNCASDPEHAWSIALADRDRRIESLEAALRETYALVKRNFVTLDPSGMYTNEVPPGVQVRIKAALREHIDATLATPPTKDEDE